MFQKIEEELKALSKYGLSWLGRINVVKKMLLTCLLYLFHALPIPKKSLRKVQSNIIQFVWGKKSHRCSKETLFRLKNRGGLGLPNLWWYYMAAQLIQISIA